MGTEHKRKPDTNTKDLQVIKYVCKNLLWTHMLVMRYDVMWCDVWICIPQECAGYTYHWTGTDVLLHMILPHKGEL